MCTRYYSKEILITSKHRNQANIEIKVGDETMLSFIRDKTAAPYFSNLVWFIGNHIVELDNCVRADAE